MPKSLSGKQIEHSKLTNVLLKFVSLSQRKFGGKTRCIMGFEKIEKIPELQIKAPFQAPFESENLMYDNISNNPVGTLTGSLQ